MSPCPVRSLVHTAANKIARRAEPCLSACAPRRRALCGRTSRLDCPIPSCADALDVFCGCLSPAQRPLEPETEHTTGEYPSKAGRRDHRKQSRRPTDQRGGWQACVELGAAVTSSAGSQQLAQGTARCAQAARQGIACYPPLVRGQGPAITQQAGSLTSVSNPLAQLVRVKVIRVEHVVVHEGDVNAVRWCAHRGEPT